MTFQQTVRRTQATGIVGEFAVDAPKRVSMANIDTDSVVANTLVGRAFTFTQTLAGYPVVEAGAVQDVTQRFAGIAITPKSYALQGTSDGTLEPTLQLVPGQEVELCRMGTIYVSLTNAGLDGDSVVFAEATGELSALAPGADLPANTVQIKGATVVNSTDAAGLTVIELTNISNENPEPSS